MLTPCTCIDNEAGERIKFCREHAIALEQGGEEWKRARLGLLTSSRASDAFARIKSGWGASRANYRAELVCERLSGAPYEGYSNHYMDRGQRIEPDAVNAYEFIVGLEAKPTGFWQHPTIVGAGASPDRLIGQEGLLEAKARTTAIHFDLLLTHTIPGKYIDQMQFSLACCEREWCDFVSYDPRAPAGMELFVQRIYRDEERISTLERQGIEFLAEVEKLTQELQERSLSGFIFLARQVQQNGDSLVAQLTDSIVMMKKKGKG